MFPPYNGPVAAVVVVTVVVVGAVLVATVVVVCEVVVVEEVPVTVVVCWVVPPLQADNAIAVMSSSVMTGHITFFVISPPFNIWDVLKRFIKYNVSIPVLLYFSPPLSIFLCLFSFHSGILLKSVIVFLFFATLP